MAPEDISSLAGNRSIARKIRRQEDCIGTQSLRAAGRHCGAYTETPSFVGSGTDHRPIATPGNDDRLAAQLRVIPLFDRSIKCVHIHMDDFAHIHLETILLLA